MKTKKYTWMKYKSHQKAILDVYKTALNTSASYLYFKPRNESSEFSKYIHNGILEGVNL